MYPGRASAEKATRVQRRVRVGVRVVVGVSVGTRVSVRVRVGVSARARLRMRVRGRVRVRRDGGATLPKKSKCAESACTVVAFGGKPLTCVDHMRVPNH